jgi:hypothetical protein
MIADNNYSQMQEHLYNVLASEWSLENRDPVVGSFDAHNNCLKSIFDGLSAEELNINYNKI